MIRATEVDRHMPIGIFSAEAIRHKIAELAAEISAVGVQHYLDLIGEVEAISATSVDGTSWRLATYFGSHAEAQTIERAVSMVQRQHPLMRTTLPCDDATLQH